MIQWRKSCHESTTQGNRLTCSSRSMMGVCATKVPKSVKCLDNMTIEFQSAYYRIEFTFENKKYSIRNMALHAYSIHCTRTEIIIRQYDIRTFFKSERVKLASQPNDYQRFK